MRKIGNIAMILFLMSVWAGVLAGISAVFIAITHFITGV